LAGPLVEAWKNGARFDSWRDLFRFSVWEDAFATCGIPYREYLGARDPDDPLPWDVIQTGIKTSHLREELKRALRAETTPSCLESKCGDCQGCELFPILEKKFFEEIRPEIGAHSFFGKPLPEAIRYRAFYSKTGEARFLSHLDLINVIQRAFRRARLSVQQSEGFHPKMLISYLPALPLGMEGKVEALEFRSPFVFEEKEFVLHLNRHLPSGVEFLSLARLDKAHPSLSKDVQGLAYALDLKSPVVEESIKARALENKIEYSDRDTALKTLIDGFLSGSSDPSRLRISLDQKREKLIIQLGVSSQKTERPQDIVESLLGIRDSVYFMAREKIIFRGDTPGN
jgi:radical SAM-linked protein